MWWPFLNKLAINHFHWMYMLINFVNLFQIIYKGVKCVQSAFTKKTFCMQKNERSERIKSNFHLFLFFSLCSKWMSVGSIENRSQLELFSFTHISNLASRKWLSVLTLANKVKNCIFFCPTKIIDILLDHSHVHKNPVWYICTYPPLAVAGQVMFVTEVKFTISTTYDFYGIKVTNSPWFLRLRFSGHLVKQDKQKRRKKS